MCQRVCRPTLQTNAVFKTNFQSTLHSIYSHNTTLIIYKHLRDVIFTVTPEEDLEKEVNEVQTRVNKQQPSRCINIVTLIDRKLALIFYLLDVIYSDNN